MSVMEGAGTAEQFSERTGMDVSLETLPLKATGAPARVSMISQFLSFAVIGGSAAALFVALSTLMIELPISAPDWLLSSICYAFFILPVYMLHRRFSFRSEAPHRHALPRYIVIQIVGLILATVFSYVCYGVFQMPTLSAAIVVVALTSGINFAILRTWAFTEGR
jgi:putative flippase GtrA